MPTFLFFPEPLFAFLKLIWNFYLVFSVFSKCVEERCYFTSNLGSQCVQSLACKYIWPTPRPFPSKITFYEQFVGCDTLFWWQLGLNSDLLFIIPLKNVWVRSRMVNSHILQACCAYSVGPVRGTVTENVSARVMFGRSGHLLTSVF